MPATTVVMPQLGESVVEGTVVRWIARPGQRVERDEPLVEVSTDKANTEVPSPSAGVLVEQLAREGAVVAVGQPLARLDDSAAPSAGPAAQGAPPAAQGAPSAGQGAASAAAQGGPSASRPPAPDGNGAAPRASPVGRKVAEEHGVDLAHVQGSGSGGRIVKADVLGMLDAGATSATQSELQPPLSTFPGQRAPSQPPPA